MAEEKRKVGRKNAVEGHWRRTRNVKRLKASIFLSSFSSVVEGLACGNNKLYPCNRSGVKGGRICCRRESMKSVEVEALRRGKSVPVQTRLRKNPYIYGARESRWHAQIYGHVQVINTMYNTKNLEGVLKRDMF